MTGLLRRVDTTELRRKRYERIARLVGLEPGDRILDLGCGPGGRSIAAFNSENEVVGVDLFDESGLQVRQPNFAYLKGDACDLVGIGDSAFDVAFSLGMLEHIRPRERLVSAVRETQRVARRYCFVVPHRYAFIEPHFYMPLFSIWPGWLRSALIKRFRLGTQGRQPSGRWQRINWLTRSQWAEVFDDRNLVIKNHWYGPFLQYYLIAGGDLPRMRAKE